MSKADFDNIDVDVVDDDIDLFDEEPVIESLTWSDLTAKTAELQSITCAYKINVKGTISTKLTHDAVDKLDFDRMNNCGKSFDEF